MEKISLRAARINANLPQKVAAKELGVSNKTLSNWENYKTFPKQPMIEKMCKLYGVTYDSLNFRG